MRSTRSEQASNASRRCPAEAAATRATSPIVSVPYRWTAARRRPVSAATASTQRRSTAVASGCAS
ncbi:hypothetical protein BJF88_12690 [Cellulosimicrobium sp. CUA-896]|nr:hypothetical protein BJF88_12690 [Cellulosimicrobium sp. CUA-896]